MASKVPEFVFFAVATVAAGGIVGFEETPLKLAAAVVAAFFYWASLRSEQKTSW
jgi:hypothetical protein